MRLYEVYVTIMGLVLAIVVFFLMLLNNDTRRKLDTVIANCQQVAEERDTMIRDAKAFVLETREKDEPPSDALFNLIITTEVTEADRIDCNRKIQ